MTRDRDIVDIPEVFRRAFDDDGWDEQGGDGDGNGGRQPSYGPGRAWWSSRWIWIAILIITLLLSFNWIVSTYTEWLWFDAQSYKNVWLTQLVVRLVSFVVLFIVAAVVLLINWRIAFKNALKTVSMAPIRPLELPGMNWIIIAIGLFASFIFASAGSAKWEQFLLFFNRQPFGLEDPVLGLDLGFYFFELPVYRFLHSWLIPLTVITIIGVAAIYLADNWMALQRGRINTNYPPSVRRHVAILLTFFFLLWASGYLLDIYEIQYSTRGVVFGASYTDLKATLPALYIQLALMVILAIITAVNIFRLSVRPFLVTAGLWLAAAILLGNVYPMLLQRYGVEPNEISREQPYIERNIEYTRFGFALNDIDSRDFGAVTELTNLDLLTNRETLQNVRLWDYRPLQQTYAQLQELRPYYEFSTVDIDRYDIEGVTRQVMLAGRELNKEDLSAPSWVNEKLQFTHGYGLVMNPVDLVSPEGRPVFFIKDLPPQSTVPITVTRPEIYYGELIDDMVLVGSDLAEFDYPVGNENAQSSYAGEGGVEIKNIWRQLAFAIRFGEANLLLSEYITPETRILLHRQIKDRVRSITPFLHLDSDPYLIVADGRLVWMLDAYTLSGALPYSTPSEQGFNYIRNPVKITVDAYHGTVDYYLVDPDDPIIMAYDRAFPGLFQPLDAMPDSLLEHIRYPEDLFKVQTQQYLKYHMDDIQTFYNQEDLWEIPKEIFESDQQPIEPYHVILSLPGEEDTEYLLIQPYVPAGKNNMVAWIAARNDPPNYGQLVVYELPKQELVFGPIQVEARIDQDPEISAQISLWNQRGSKVIRGNLIVIPMNNSFLYVEPLYLLSEASELPELKRVIVASGDRVAMRETLEEALLALIEMAPSVVDTTEVEGQEPAESVGSEPTPAPGESAAATSTPQIGQLVDTIESLVQEANDHFEAAEEAQRAGDWATYGRELKTLQDILVQLLELTDFE
ncbi:MAG TPA: UPF0182 family protein [candidate division Zixibacteria bacterium]|nr:UPF0182 family protein [candidate division Zixibacteria bacterium]